MQDSSTHAGDSCKEKKNFAPGTLKKKKKEVFF